MTDTCTCGHVLDEHDEATGSCLIDDPSCPCGGFETAEDEPAEGSEDPSERSDPYRYLGDQASRMRAYKDALLADLHARLKLVDTSGEGPNVVTPGELDGVRIVTHRDLEEALALTELPPPTAHAADIATPATVTVMVTCPDCGEGAYLTTVLSAELLASVGKRELRLKGKATSAPHQHGQRVLRSVGEEPTPGQQSLDQVIEGQATELEDEDEDLDDDQGGEDLDEADH